MAADSYEVDDLLISRAERAGLLLVVVGTPDGYVMASSRDRADRQGARLAAHASAELFRGPGRAQFALSAPSWPGVRLLGMKIEAEGRPAFIAAIVPVDRAFSLEELARCVTRILNEPARELEKVAA